MILKSYCPFVGDVHALACVSCGSYGLQLLGYIKHTMLDAWASLPEVGAGNHWQGALVARHYLRIIVIVTISDRSQLLPELPTQLTTFRQSALSRSRTSGTRRLQGGFVVRQKTSRLCFGECAHARSRALQGSDLSTHSRGSIRARGCPRCQSGVEIDVRTLPVNLFSFPYYLIVAQSDIGRIKIV